MTILKDKETRESKGVAFVLFLDRQMAQKAVAAINKKQVHVLLIRQNILGGRRWVAVGVMYQSNRSFNIPPPPGIPRAFDVFSCPGGREFD